MPSQNASQIPPMAIGSDVWPGLGKTAEEAGELLQIVGKLIAYPNQSHPDGSDTTLRLHEEIADLQAALEFVIETNVLHREFIDARRAKKLERFRRWHREERLRAV